MATIGYKKRVSFSSLLSPQDNVTASSVIDFSPGKQINTKNPYDLAVAGRGLFVVQAPSGVFYTRQGQFQRGTDGRLLTSQGFALQTQNGGDLILKTDNFLVLSDGTVIEDGQAVAKLAVVDFTDPSTMSATDGGLFTAPPAAVAQMDAPSVRQGALEASNVSTGDEMVSIMEALRRAESGQRLMNLYDDLMGRALSAFGGA